MLADGVIFVGYKADSRSVSPGLFTRNDKLSASAILFWGDTCRQVEIYPNDDRHDPKHGGSVFRPYLEVRAKTRDQELHQV